MADIPDELIKLERSAVEAHAKLTGLDGDAYDVQWKVWRSAAEDIQTAVTAYAAREVATVFWPSLSMPTLLVMRV
ncbi:hypothetical protein ACFYMX_07520 [Streptomyces griseofuscus]|uniref:hypothetical protein n=1 Tax=Streptomyces griseofuscus TaxID=146922 RepID=UPI003687AE82